MWTVAVDLAVVAHLWTIVSVHVAKALTTTVITPVETVTHTDSCLTAGTGTAKVAPVVPASATIHSPTVSAMIRSEEVRATEEEVVAVRVAGVDAEMPVTAVPVEWAIEIGGIEE